MVTENNFWQPSLLPQDQKQLERFQKERHLKWRGFAHKTLWDWLQLLIIPIVLAAGVIWLNFTQTQISFESSQKQHDTNVQIALDQQRQEALVTYQEDISDMLLTQKLNSSSAGDEVRVVARARTLDTLRILDSERKGFLIKFLYEAQLITGGSPIISLMNADLRGADLSEADLRGADLISARLQGADLISARLQGADLSGADLSGADLSGADLRRANVTVEQLNKAKSLGGATIPDGSIQP